MSMFKTIVLGSAIGFSIVFTTAVFNWEKIEMFVICNELDICKDYGPDP